MSDTPRTEAEVNRQKCWSDDFVTIDAGPMKVDGGIKVYVRSQTARQLERQLERELNAANERIKRLEEALGLVLKMRNDWLEMQDDGYAGAYYAFVKGNDSEWEEIIKAKEAKP